MKKIQIAIVGYGNLGKGVELSVAQQTDMEVFAVYSRRPAECVQSYGAAVRALSDLQKDAEHIDVAILCGGSATDLIEQGPEISRYANTVDAFDTHARIPEYFTKVKLSAQDTGHTAIISTGWDPGLFSLNRILAQSILTDGKLYTFWGKGVSQGHSDALRRIPGVAKAVQYTIPNAELIAQIEKGEDIGEDTYARHTRECYVVLQDVADADTVEKAIVSMPNYFKGYRTIVHFIDDATFEAEHKGMPHGGQVIASGTTGTPDASNHQLMRFSLDLGKNSEFTAAITVAYARACYRLNQKNEIGAYTVFDVAPGLLSPLTPEELRAHYL